MPHQCKLILDNYLGHYVPGAPIQGRVLLNLDTDTNLRGEAQLEMGNGSNLGRFRGTCGVALQGANVMAGDGVLL